MPSRYALIGPHQLQRTAFCKRVAPGFHLVLARHLLVVADEEVVDHALRNQAANQQKTALVKFANLRRTQFVHRKTPLGPAPPATTKGAPQ